MAGHPWLIDGYVRCPGCGRPDDGAAMFGEQPATDDLPHDHPDATFTVLEDGTEGTCTRCGAAVVVHLTVKEPGP